MSDAGGTTPISSRNFPPAGAGMRCGDAGAVTTLMGRGGRASRLAEGPPARPPNVRGISEGLFGLVAKGEALLQLSSNLSTECFLTLLWNKLRKPRMATKLRR